jgi:hypothetical protein
MENSNFREYDIQNQMKLYIVVKNMNIFFKTHFSLKLFTQIQCMSI